MSWPATAIRERHWSAAKLDLGLVPRRTSPDCGSMSRARIFTIVVFPAPESPMSAVTDPAGMEKLAPSSATLPLG